MIVEILAELETMTHAARMRRMVQLGQQSRTDAPLALALKDLGGGGFYERYLALMSCFGSGNAAHVTEALGDGSRKLRVTALKLAALILDDAEALAALNTLPPKAQASLVRELVRKRRISVVDQFLGQLATANDARLEAWLAFGSPGFIAAHLRPLLPRFGVHDWARLARLHPYMAFESLMEPVRAQTEASPRLQSQADAILPSLAHRRPDNALALVRELARHQMPSHAGLEILADCRPNEVADLLLQVGTVQVSLSHVAHRLTSERRIALLHSRPALLGSASQWLPRLAPDTRQAAWEAGGRGWQNKEGVVDLAIVAALPAALREPEARRNLVLPALATRPQSRLPYATFLPWDEAAALLKPFIGNPDADLRSVALPALIGAARYHLDRLPDVLSLIRARANEQDPVRLVMLTSLATLPSGRWRIEHLDDLSQIIADALAASDLSPSTARAAETLVIHLVRYHPVWAAKQLVLLVRARGQVGLYGLESRLTDADTQRIAPALLPVFSSWETREREGLLVQAATSLGRRLRVFPDLVSMLERLLDTTRASYLASSILSLLKQHRPDRLAALIPGLLEKDRSVVTLEVVYEHLHRHRQDLITPYLGRQVYSGRFLSGKTRWVLPVRGGFHRWTPAQQETFAQTLGEVTDDKARDTPSILQVMVQLAALPAVAPVQLARLAQVDNPRPAIRDGALRRLAHLDSGQGVPLLVDALSDNRARIAIYALRSALLEMPPDRALDLLRAAPTGKVTVAKEVVRLLGELKTPGAYPVLLDMARADPPPHRDVQIALLRAFWDHLESEETWIVLNRAATSSDPAIARSLASVTSDRLSPTAQTALLRLLAMLLRHPDALVRLAALQRCRVLPVADPDRILLPALLAGLRSGLPDEYGEAALAVFSTYTGKDALLIGDAVAQVRENRAVLLAITSALRGALGSNRARFLPSLRAVLVALETDPLTVRLRIELAASGLSADDFAALLARLDQTGALHAEALMAAVDAVASWSRRDEPATGRSPLSALEASLALSQSANLRRIALAVLVARSARTAGWTAELRARLDAYRADPAPLVASAAQFILLPPNQ